MSVGSFTIKQNNTRTALKATLTESDGTKVNLTGATVNFVMSSMTGVVVINRAATIEDAPNGVVWVTFQATETAQSGNYRAEFKVTFSDGSVESYPNNDYISVNIVPSLN